MGITYRQDIDGRLSVQQMDDNFHYIEEQLANSQAPTYKVYTALLSQSGTASPTVTVLEDNFGYEWNFIRFDEGNYQIQDFTNNPFTDNKTIGFITLSGGTNNKIVNFTQAFSALVQFAVIDTTGDTVDLNGFAQIEIRVYN